MQQAYIIVSFFMRKSDGNVCSTLHVTLTILATTTGSVISFYAVTINYNEKICMVCVWATGHLMQYAGDVRRGV